MQSDTELLISFYRDTKLFTFMNTDGHKTLDVLVEDKSRGRQHGGISSSRTPTSNRFGLQS
jgi:hypothetical protein